MRTSSLSWSVVALLVMLHASRGDSVAQSALQWRILDSAVVDSWDQMGEISMYRVQVRRGSRNTVVTRVIAPLPISVGDSELIGLRFDQQRHDRRLFRWRASTNRLEQFRLPRDVWVYSYDVVVAPSGRFVAYVAQDSASYEMFGAVRAWPSGRLVLRGPRLPGCDCDVDMNHARWVASDSFEIAVAGLRGRYLRISGNAEAARIHIDTLPSQPLWHGKP